MKNIEIGDRVTVSMTHLMTTHRWLRDYIHFSVSRKEVGTVKRIAGNGKIGIQFDSRIFRENVDHQLNDNVYSLHGMGKVGFSLYVPEQFIHSKNSEREGVEVVRKEVNKALVSLGAYDDVVSVL